MTKKRVVIVGGGLAGLSAAESLLRRQADRFDVTILEAKRRTGGRAGSFVVPSSGDEVDYCQHVAMGCCTNLLGLLNRCGLSDWMQRYSEFQFLHPEFRASRFAPFSWLPAPLHLAMTIGSLNYLTWAQQRRVRHGMLRLMRTNTAKLSGITAAKWLSETGQDATTIRDFWDVILVSALGESTQHVSMSAARKVMIDGFAAARGASDVLVPKLPLSVLFGERLTNTIQAMGAKIQSAVAAETIQSHPVGVVSSNGLFEADHVISAVPWHQIDKLVNDESQKSSIANFESITKFPSSPITGIHLWFDRPVTDQPHQVLVGTTAQWLFNDPFSYAGSETPTSNGPKKQEYYYQIVISASHEARAVPKDELVQTVHNELRRAFPSTSAARLFRSQIVTDPHSVFSVRPEVESNRPPARTALPWLHLAGDWIATGWPATMEGAVISGIMAANSVRTTEGIEPVDPCSGLEKGLLSRMMIKP